MKAKTHSLRVRFVFIMRARREKSPFEKVSSKQIRGYIKNGRAALKPPTAARCSSVLEEIMKAKTHPLRVRFVFIMRARREKNSFEKVSSKQIRGYIKSGRAVLKPPTAAR